MLCLHFTFSTSQLILANLSNYTENSDMQNDRITSEYKRATRHKSCTHTTHTAYSKYTNSFFVAFFSFRSFTVAATEQADNRANETTST